MEFINAEIVAITNAYKKGTNFKLPAATAWKRRINMNKLMEVRDVIDNAIREEIAPYFDEEHSVEDGDGRTVKPEYREEVLKKQSEILSQKTDVEIKMVGIDEVGSGDLSDEDMDTLAFMIKEA